MERLLAFRAVARERSFSRGAGRIHRTQPAVSQAVRSLEHELGERLFMRTGRTALLTQAGRILLEHVESAFDSLDRARSHIEALRELREGELTLVTSDTTACYLLPDALRRFRARYPAVEVKILNRPSPVAARQVASHDVDLGIVTLPVENDRLTSEVLMKREDVLICSPRHPLAKRRSLRLSDLAGLPLLLLDRGSSTRGFIDRQLRAAGLAPNVAMELGSIEVIKKLVELDFGVSIVPAIAVRAEAKTGRVCAKPIFKDAECRRLGLVYLKQGIPSLSGRVFAKMLKEHLSEPPRRDRSRAPEGIAAPAGEKE